MPKKKLYVVFRLDDYSAKSSTDIEVKIIEAFRKNGLPITFGVIPFILEGDLQDPSSSKNIIPLSPLKGDILRDAVNEGTLDIALHGFSHQTNNVRKMSEFRGMDLGIQLERLGQGKNFLEGIVGDPVATFVPPWNSYDSITLRALEQLGFSTISADLSGDAPEYSRLKFLPAVSDISQLKDAVKAGRKSLDDQPVIVVLFHNYDFKEVDETRGKISYGEFAELLSWLNFQEDISIVSISQATKAIQELSSRRFVSNKINKLLTQKLLPSFFWNGDANLYLKNPKLMTSFVLVLFFYFAIMLLWAAVAFYIGSLVLRRFVLNVRRSAFFISIVLSAFSLIFIFYDLKVGMKGMVTAASVLGVNIGMFFNFHFFQRQSLD
ncbi:MAG: DUF2334 domain-containing protein [Desulfobulbus sp.]|nr:DUF2334 domain-containing protein [Desulfobulbus sp.]